LINDVGELVITQPSPTVQELIQGMIVNSGNDAALYAVDTGIMAVTVSDRLEPVDIEMARTAWALLRKGDMGITPGVKRRKAAVAVRSHHAPNTNIEQIVARYSPNFWPIISSVTATGICFLPL
jgi:hypothetical protein